MRKVQNIISVLLLSVFIISCAKQPGERKERFNEGWKFYLGQPNKAHLPDFEDKDWRTVSVPHDWSIEPVPTWKDKEAIGPFSRKSEGGTATGHVLGGIGWYRNSFTLSKNDIGKRICLYFEGVYNHAEVWVNGHKVYFNSYGYSAFTFDVTEFCNPPGQANIIAVEVSNLGKNSRWYSGSGIYRNVWLIKKQPVYVEEWDSFLSTNDLNGNNALMQFTTTVHNSKKEDITGKLALTIKSPKGKKVYSTIERVTIPAFGSEKVSISFSVENAELWSPDSPALYDAEVSVSEDNQKDEIVIPFGIRTISVSAEEGLLLNGNPVLLKGGCLHHDNGFLGSAAIDRAEERKVELMKQYGFNAIRTAHNPSSEYLLEACDRLGILVIDEAFDQWERPKNPQDYHLFFNEWWDRDIETLIQRDRNHPSVIMWSIGNEINERVDSTGFAIRKRLVAKVKELDSTRPVTEGICDFWDHPGKEWSSTAPAFANLDAGGYNYLWYKYESDHELYPNRVMIGTEVYPGAAYDSWKQVEKNSWVIGDFVWTAMDYLGETGVGNSHLDNDPDQGMLRSWPWFNAYCGDIDLCGFKKPQMYYKDVVWNNSKLEIMVHTPIPEGRREIVNYWGWPDEQPVWNWDGHENATMDVRVFSSYPLVRLELNGNIIAEQQAGENSKYIAHFKVPYEPGILKAIALENDMEVAVKELKTTGKPSKIKLTADRTKIKADRNDLSYVKIEITDNEGNIIPDANIPVRLTVSEMGEIAGSGNSCPYDMQSFNNSVCSTYRGQALAILRPKMANKSGTMILKAEAEYLEEGKIEIILQ